MEELANPKPGTEPLPVRATYLAELVLILMDRVDDLEQRLSRPVSPLSTAVRPRLAALTQEDLDAFLMEYGNYVMDEWGDFRALRTALGTLLVRLEQKQRQTKQKQSKGRRKRA
jgi:hypothetical protein